MPRSLLFGVLLLLPLGAASAEYRGRVGRLEAVFTLDWRPDGSVGGVYHYPSRAGVVYELRGSNPAEGELRLEEYTGGTLTARCILSKSIEGGTVVWRGEMRNTDGGTFPMEFSRVVEAAPTASGGPAEQDYSGYVGRLGAEFRLRWHDDGTVAGSYGYPARPGITYRLAGSNPAEGELRLEEYTGGNLTARCILRKRLEDGAIVWEGMMWNTDGRRFPMAFSRARDNAPAAVSFDDFEAKRRGLLGRIPDETVWDEFPMAGVPVEMVPVDVEDSEYFGAKVLEFRSDAAGSELVLLAADWDVEGGLRTGEGRRLRLRAARPLPLPPDSLLDREVAIQVAPDGTLLSVELTDILVTAVRRGRDGKLEVRGALDLFDIEESFDWDESVLREKLRAATPVEFLPDKLALSIDPAAAAENGRIDLGFQTIRLVRDYGIVIQATSAGPGSLELESLSLDQPAEANPWIPLNGLREAIEAPPNQLTRQAG